ncbi:MAG: 3,4-dihydroxy-2-butanone-4-phosphate synthase, partial [Planctomycetota bacterium]
MTTTTRSDSGTDSSTDTTFATIPELLDELRAGRMIVMCDDEDRENEGDLIVAAEHITVEQMAFMIRHTGGVVCLVLTGEACDRLGLEMMVPKNTTPRGTAMTVAIDAARGISTGISAADRTTTIRTALRADARPEDLARPGHIFPLRAREGGVLVRTGHTEASIDLCRFAGLKPAAVLSELMIAESGEMMRLPHCKTFCAQHELKLGLVRDLVEYRRRTERLVERVARVQMPTDAGAFDCYAYTSTLDGREHIALVHGFEPDANNPEAFADTPILVRVHSECLTGDVFHSLRCDCGQQLHAAL